MKIKERALSLLLSMVMVLTFMPALAFADDEDPEEETSYVTALNYTAVNYEDRFTFYDGLNMSDTSDGDHDYKTYYYGWEAGDTLDVTYSNGDTESLECRRVYYDDGGYSSVWFVAGTDKEPLYSVDMYEDSSDRQAYNHSWGIGEHTIYIGYGYGKDGEEKTTTLTAKVLENPVSEISFTPTANPEYPDTRFEFLEGEEYWFGFELGDKLTAVVNGIPVTYEYKEGYDEDGYFGAYFFDSNDKRPKYGSVDWDYNKNNWTAGADDNYITILFANKSCQVPVNMKANPVTSISYEPVKPIKYSQAEMAWFGYHYEWDDGDAVYSGYDYSVPFVEGDKMTLTIDGEEVTYEYKMVEVPGKNYWHDVFVDENNNELDEEYLDSLSYSTEGDSRISVGTHVFTGSYMGREFSAEITVTESSDDEIELEEAKSDAVDELYELPSYINWSAYRAAQKEELYEAIYGTIEKIRNAASISEVTNLVASAKAKVASVKTDAQLSEEERAAATPAEIIDLPTVKISKPKAAKKKITVKWKKVSKKNLKKISGIQIQVATDPGFTNIVKTATAGKKKTSKAIKGLQPKTKYYVRIRAYAAGNHYSVWKGKSAKVK